MERGARKGDRRWRVASIVALGAAAAVLANAEARAGSLTVLHSFDYADGQFPEGRLVEGDDGNFYGTTYAGGASGLGTAFRVTPGGVHTILHSFTGSDGDSLSAGLVKGGQGNFRGTTPQGSISVGGVSTSFGGTIFKLTPDGTLTTQHSFPGNGQPDGSLPGDLTAGGDGFFYGTTNRGGAAGVNSVGTIFKTTPAGVFTTLHSFTVAEGAYPGPGLTKALDGNLYGTTQYGPHNTTYGAIFKATPAGVVSNVHTFTGADGASPGSFLVQDASGNLFGVTGGGGSSGNGTVFKMTTAGVVTTLHSFNGDDGQSPVDGLVAGADGNYYGVTFGGGTDGGGTIFKITPSGTFLTLHMLTPQDGTRPVAALIRGNDDALYGTTTDYGGAPGASGSAFRFDPSAAQPPELVEQKICYNELGTCLTPINVILGQKYTVEWSSANVTSCTASGAWKGTKAVAGRVDFKAAVIGALPYKLACTGPSGTINASVVVTVGL